MFIKPAKGLIIRNPQTMEHVPVYGMEVPESSYWRRRLKDGDIVRMKPRKEAKIDL